MEVTVYLDRDLDVKVQVSVPRGSTVRALKQQLADSDPTGQTDPAAFVLTKPHTAQALRDTDLVPEDVHELDVCTLEELKAAASPPPRPAPPPPERKPVSSSSIRDSEWAADCEVAFQAAAPPSWEFQERPRGAWVAFPKEASAEINAMARRGQRRGTISLNGSEVLVDLEDMAALPAGPRAMPRMLRKTVSQVSVDKRALKTLYCKYAEELEPSSHPAGPDGIAGEGLLELFADLGVDPASDVAALAFSWACQASEMGTFRRREFICGCAKVEVDSLDGLRYNMSELRSSLLSGKTLSQVYAYIWSVALEPPSKVLPFEEARQYWELLLHDWPLREAFCDWAEGNMKKQAINKDLWMMVLQLARDVPPDLSTYDDNPAWPVVIDEFVEHYRETHGK
mmetsp:Transcript_232/g.482  ORF Transcript_232/g.482 Transcript_232/m.482 type:complete len:397 (-) Transcript_232:120-1310(-)|eukprot:CAMPEP_0180503432 /NCGR_PEP_ID=MMETSP1036_2-20121128/46039_1 /TAXON_ID=632150 /ORGANISM="Azadinium spinosum, Strain 3D9" /LENGTH=396 /DNA_ID=CAMNT_0022512479 /DNA_START=64 /DNA_END=1254 /DNA_ORIENTATION=+